VAYPPNGGDRQMDNHTSRQRKGVLVMLPLLFCPAASVDFKFLEIDFNAKTLIHLSVNNDSRINSDSYTFHLTFQWLRLHDALEELGHFPVINLIPGADALFIVVQNLGQRASNTLSHVPMFLILAWIATAIFDP
jgi:hypothetical protein